MWRHIRTFLTSDRCFIFPWILDSFVFVSLESEQIKANNLIQTFATYYPQYEVSFDIKPSHGTVSAWANILHITQGDGNGIYGDRNPAVWFWPGSHRLHICSAINGDKSHCYDSTTDLPTDKYTHVYIKQEKKANGIHFFTVTLNGKEAYRIQNNQPQTFQNVKFYQASPWYTPANAFIGNIKVSTIKD